MEEASLKFKVLSSGLGASDPAKKGEDLPLDRLTWI